MGRSIGKLLYSDINILTTFNSDCEFELDDLKFNFVEDLTNKYPSLYECEEWDNESVIILKNDLCEIAFTTYYDILSIDVRFNENTDYYSNSLIGLYKRYSSLIEAYINENYGTITRIATFSNGEGIFEKKVNL